MFRFHKFNELTDGEISLILDEHLQGKHAMEGVPAYKFKIIRNRDHCWIGDIDVRIGITENLYLFGGQIGYGILPPYRGHAYAAKACLIIQKVAISHGMDELWITCNPDNIASIKTCDAIGAKYIDTVKVPVTSELYARGDRKKCRYYWQLSQAAQQIV